MSLLSHVIPKPRGFILTFENPGDILPMHSHQEDTVHVTCIMRGRFRVHGPTIGDNEYSEGTFLDWAVGTEHEIIALTANARLAQFLKEPDSYNIKE